MIRSDTRDKAGGSRLAARAPARLSGLRCSRSLIPCELTQVKVRWATPPIPLFTLWQPAQDMRQTFVMSQPEQTEVAATSVQHRLATTTSQDSVAHEQAKLFQLW